MKALLCFLLIVLLSIPDSGQSPTVTVVLENYLTLTGGKGKLDSLFTAGKSYRYYSLYGKKDTTLIESREKMPSYSYTKAATLNGDVKYETFYSKDKLVMASYKPFPSVNTIEIKSEKFVHPAQEILKLYRRGSLRKILQEKLNGIDVYKITSKAQSPELSKTFYFEKASGNLIATQTGQLPDNFNYFDDYRKAGEVLFPFTHKTYQKETALDLTIFDSVEFNVPIHDSIFYYDELTAQPRRDKNSKHNSIEWVESSPANFNDLQNAFKGQRILIDIWATWCGPCKMEFLKYSDEFYDFLASYNVKMLFISTDKPEHAKTWKRDVAWFNTNGLHLLAAQSLQMDIHKKFSIDDIFYIPRYMLLDSDGKVLSDNLPKPSMPDFKRKFEFLLK